MNSEIFNMCQETDRFIFENRNIAVPGAVFAVSAAISVPGVVSVRVAVCVYIGTWYNTTFNW
jgi:hypothetical protein